MIELSTVDPRNVREVTVPILPESVKEYFTNKDIVFLADYAASRFKGVPFLTFLSNINVPCEVQFSDQFTAEMHNELLVAYMSQRMVTSSLNLAIHAAQIVLYAKGMPYDEIPYRTNITEQQLFDFFKNNTELVGSWMLFLDSMPVLCVRSIPATRNTMNIDQLPQVVDKTAVGHNVVNLFSLPMFTAAYAGLDKTPVHLAYYKHQFEDYMFGNKHILNFFANHNNTLLLSYALMANEPELVDNPNNTEAVINRIRESVQVPEGQTMEFFDNDNPTDNPHPPADQNGQLPNEPGAQASDGVSPESQP